MKQEKATDKILLKQMIMRKVLLALVLAAGLTGFIVEFIFTHKRNEPVTEAVFVTTTIFALIMPPTVPWYVLIIGVVFAVMFTKEIFGGFGRNIFNPALAGRCFVYICFPIALTATWAPVAQGCWGALNKWTTVSSINAITSATPMADIKAGNLIVGSQGTSNKNDGKIIERKVFYKTLLLGRISGTMGVTSALLILVGGIYLFVTKTANRTIVLSLIITYAVLNQTLYMLDVEPVNDAIAALLGGGFLFGAFFMATDPISAPRTEQAKIFYGIIIAICTIIIRNFSIFNGGLMFSILIGNMFAPLLDSIVRSFKTTKSIGGKA
jgi:Na+-transporting NADH:ubiquinone oxidoreductase subunit B